MSPHQEHNLIATQQEETDGLVAKHIPCVPSLHALLQDNVGELVKGSENAHEVAAIAQDREEFPLNVR